MFRTHVACFLSAATAYVLHEMCDNCSNGTSMISLIIPPKDMIARVNKMLGDEYGTASNIKSRVNRSRLAYQPKAVAVTAVRMHLCPEATGEPANITSTSTSAKL